MPTLGDLASRIVLRHIPAVQTVLSFQLVHQSQVYQAAPLLPGGRANQCHRARPSLPVPLTFLEDRSRLVRPSHRPLPLGNKHNDYIWAGVSMYNTQCSELAECSIMLCENINVKQSKSYI